MNIRLENIGKKFKESWVFRNLNYSLESGRSYAIVGPNGSGKSTLIQIISGITMPSEGDVVYNNDGTDIPVEKVYRKLSMAAPYLQLMDNFTVREICEIHRRFKKLNGNISTSDFLQLSDLNNQQNQFVSELSSGLLQRLKLGLAILSDVDLLLLDEPLTNLDERGKKWYAGLIDEFGHDRTVVVCSNHQKAEYEFCRDVVSLGDQ